MKLLGLSGKVVAVGAVAVAVLVVGVLATRSSPSAEPAGPRATVEATTPAGQSAAPKIRDTVTGAGGFDIRYLDERGQTRRLDVKDFPR